MHPIIIGDTGAIDIRTDNDETGDTNATLARCWFVPLRQIGVVGIPHIIADGLIRIRNPIDAQTSKFDIYRCVGGNQ